MDTWTCILTVLMVSAIGAKSQLSVQISKEKANIGDDVEVTCTIAREDVSPFLYIVWLRREGDTEVEIGVNAFLNIDFTKTGRYDSQVDLKYDDNNDLIGVISQLNIKDVKPEDSGEIGCRIPQENIESFRPLTVSAKAPLSVTVQISKEKANIGDDVEVTCSIARETIDGEDGSNFPYIVWLKKAGDTEVEIGVNTFLNIDFKKMGRYDSQVDLKYDDNNEQDLIGVIFQLNIKDVKPEDSGEIGCRIPQEKIESFRPLTVSAT